MSSAPPKPWPELLERILEGGLLEESEASALMEAWLSEQLSAVHTGAFLAALRSREPNPQELAAMALVLRQAAPPM